MNGDRPSVAAYLEARGMTDDELAAAVGVQTKTVQARKSERDRPMPKAWADRLEAGDPNVSQRGRDDEQTPQAPPEAPRVEPEPSPLADQSFETLAGYIEGAYKLGAAAVSASDVPLGRAIDDHAKQAGEAWARWVESEPKVKALLERMMVGTPLGEVIAVHVGIGFAYFLSRSAIERARREEAAARAQAAGDVVDEHFGDFVEEPVAA